MNTTPFIFFLGCFVLAPSYADAYKKKEMWIPQGRMGKRDVSSAHEVVERAAWVPQGRFGKRLSPMLEKMLLLKHMSMEQQGAAPPADAQGAYGSAGPADAAGPWEDLSKRASWVPQGRFGKRWSPQGRFGKKNVPLAGEDGQMMEFEICFRRKASDLQEPCYPWTNFKEYLKSILENEEMDMDEDLEKSL